MYTLFLLCLFTTLYTWFYSYHNNNHDHRYYFNSYTSRLNICAGTAVRFEPSETKTVSLVPISGNKIISGGNNIVRNALQQSVRLDDTEPVTKKQKTDLISISIGQPPPGFTDILSSLGFCHQTQQIQQSSTRSTMTRESYAQTFGPTVGDRVRLGDTNLIIEIERDYCAGLNGENYGDEVKYVDFVILFSRL